jgi:hypothetical protein
MTFNMRQEPREKIDRPAWISIGGSLPLLNCTLIDISDNGARLALSGNAELPEKFSLWLSRHGHPRYTCRIVWSGQKTIGVQFSSGYEQPTLTHSKL